MSKCFSYFFVNFVRYLGKKNLDRTTMDIQRIQKFLRDVAANNNRDWFHAHKAEFDACQENFRQGIDALIAQLAKVDPEIKYLTAKDCCYRFYRDVRFSQDKSPYKRHFGAYICSAGKKSLRGGYYIHVQPGQSLVAFGCYYLPTNILTSCRNEIKGNIEHWKEAVENGQFIKAFGYPNAGTWTDEEVSEKGFGLTALKTAPKGFDKNDPDIDYLRMKDYVCWKHVDDNFFQGDEWMKKVVGLAKIAKPSMDIINSVVDDYI